ncbi:MAG TPA: SurA N-terminal domain-containing protein, partial [Bdellovibrionales bacterium]|nr:SurA N-terminal domain-containing protein [Bdellovibrionales bacterium]
MSMVRISSRVLIGCTLFILAACTSEEDRISKQPVVTIDGRSLEAKEFARRLAAEMKAFDALYAKHPQNVARVKEDVIQKFVNEALIERWAVQNGIKISDADLEAEVRKVRAQYPDDIAFRGAFAKEGLSLDTWKERLRKSLLAQAVYSHVIKEVKDPPEAELQ